MQRETLGMMISTYRRKLGMTQAELAAKMNVTDKAVSKWERDLSCPDMYTLPKLADIFGLTVDELMRARSQEKPPIQNKIQHIIQLVFKAVTLASGVAVVVLSAMKQLDSQTAVTLLGIGVTCAGICLISSEKENA